MVTTGDISLLPRLNDSWIYAEATVGLFRWNLLESQAIRF